MIAQKDLKKLSPILWEIPKNYRADMLVPARLYATKKMLKEVFSDKTLGQLINVTTLPGIQKAAYVMPDAHEGYGFPIGAVAATKWPNGIISPGGIGYDINCGVRLLKTHLTYEKLKPYLQTVTTTLYRAIPSGVGRGGNIKLTQKQFNLVLENGVLWTLQENYAEKEDLASIESSGKLENADASCVSQHAKSRGHDQLGTMGAGNHFVEVDKVDQIFDDQTAEKFAIFKDQIVILIHTGSRGLGHQVATDYIRAMLKVMPKYRITLPDRQLACVPYQSPEGTAYFAAMAASANFAWANRQLITWEVRQAWKRVLGKTGGNLDLLYDVAHNIAKIEEHSLDGIKTKLIVHRKGATRAFGPGHPELNKKYQLTGQPVIIPGSMGTASYILVGTSESMHQAFGSTCHGAGRRLSRHQAKKEVNSNQLLHALKTKGIVIQTGSISALSEEAPQAYKNVDEVIEVVTGANLAKKVARLKPLAVIKG